MTRCSVSLLQNLRKENPPSAAQALGRRGAERRQQSESNGNERHAEREEQNVRIQSRVAPSIAPNRTSPSPYLRSQSLGAASINAAIPSGSLLWLNSKI